jgi:hypothetical protein
MNFCMLRFVKQTVLLLGVLIGCQSAFGFALIGPPTPPPSDNYQAPIIAYNVGGGEAGTPRNSHEEYRRNTPVVYYAFDQSFWEYFGVAGIAEIDKAMAMFNSVGKVSQVDPNDYPLDSRRVNFRAATDGLVDLKSFTMGLLTQELGLFEPSRWVWALNSRVVLPGPPPCPANMQYSIYQFNFTPFPDGTDTYPTTTYVNGTLYSYFIFEACTGPNPLADAVEVPVDIDSQPYSAVADFTSLWYTGLPVGGFYTTLTLDDVAGLKYLYNTNNFNNEASGARVTEFITNNPPTFIQTQDLGLFAAQARTNSAAALAALYPGLVITSTTNFFGLGITTNITEILVSSPLDPVGVLPSHARFSTNYTTNVVSFFDHTFGNIVTNTFSSHGIIGVLTLGLVNPNPFAPVGTLPLVTTNNTLIARPLPVAGVFGDFFILPTNVCGAQILSNLLTTVTATTNPPTTTAPALTNAAITFVPGSITFTTNHTLAYIPITCPVDSVGERGGVDRVIFIRRDFDDITGRNWSPVTNDYTLVEHDEANRVYNLRHFQRRVPRPDILFSTANFASIGTPFGTTIGYTNSVDGVTNFVVLSENGIGATIEITLGSGYDQAGRDANKAGPGTIIDPPILSTILIFNRIDPDFLNLSATSTNSFLFPSELTQQKFAAWGSFDGTTNAPVVYPNGTSLTELENQFLAPAPTTRFLPDGTVGVAYSAQFSAVGGTPPYTWALAPGSPSLPSGLNLTPDGQITGTPDGPPSIYDFTVRLTDANGVFADVPFTISIF